MRGLLERSSSTRNAAGLALGADQDRDSIIIGGSYLGSSAGCDANIARQLAEGGFVALSVPAKGSDACAMADLLGFGTDYGFAVLAEHTDGAVANAANIIEATEDYGCHTNLGGQVLSSSSHAATLALAVAADNMRSAMHWGVPLTNVSSVQAALSLADHGLPLADVVVPLAVPQAVLDLYASLRTGIGRDVSVDATPAITIPLYSDDASDSHVRFAAYLSLTELWESYTHGESNGKLKPFGALWWDGLGKCAPVGSSKFALVAGINRRITQASWTTAILETNSSSVRVWSTTKLQVPGSVKPGSTKGGLVETMDEELLLFEFSPSADGESGGILRAFD